MAIRKINNKYGASYQVRIRGADGRYITKVVQSRREAETYETTLLNQRNHSVLPTQSGNRITMDEYFVLWFEAVKFQASLGWRKQQEKMYANHIKPVIGQIKLGKVSASLIALILNRMANRGLSPAARLHIYGLLRKLFSDANELFGLLSTSPVIKQLRPKLIIKEASYLNLDQLKRLLSYASGKPYELAIGLGVYLGLRVGEIQALRWQDVDFEKRLIHIRRTYSKHEYQFRDYPKNRKHHSVCIPSELFALLVKAKSEARGELVVQPANYQMLDYWTYRKVLKLYCLEANVPVIATHGLRHSTSELGS